MKKPLALAIVFLCLLFLYTPIALMMLMAFNASRYGEWPIEWSFTWFERLFNNAKLLKSAQTSLSLAGLTAVLCVVLGLMLVLGSIYFRKKARRAIDSLVLLPLTVPWIILGLSLLLLLRWLGVEKSMFFVLMGHTVVSLPYAVLVIGARMGDMDKSLIEASASLGANSFTTFRRLILPTLTPALLSGGFLAFLISFDNFVVSYFLIPAGQSTLPMQIYSAIKFGFTPEINAISTLLICVTALAALLFLVFARSSLKSFMRG